MCAHLAAVDTIHFPHALLYEGVPGLGLHRASAVRLHDVERVPGQPRIVDDRGAGMTPQERLGEQTHDVVPLDELALLVEKEATVIVAVPGHGQVGAMRAQRLDRCTMVRDQHRVRHAVRKAAVGLVLHLDELERQKGLQLVDDQPGAAVTCVDDHLEGLELRAYRRRKAGARYRPASRPSRTARRCGQAYRIAPPPPCDGCPAARCRR